MGKTVIFMFHEWNLGTSSFVLPVYLLVFLSLYVRLSICVSVAKTNHLNVGQNFFTVRDRDFIFDMQT